MKKAYTVRRVCAALGIARSTFYERLARQAAAPSAKPARFLAEVAVIRRQSRTRYGRWCLSQELHRRAFNVGPFQAHCLMRQAGLVADVPKLPAHYPPSKGRVHAKVPNRLARCFEVTVPGTVFGGDITYIPTQRGWLYLVVVMDLCARRIVGWALSATPDTTLVIRALRLARPHRYPTQALRFHSDQVCQYTSEAFRRFLAQEGITQSLSRRGNGGDNAPVERFFRSPKSEWIRRSVYADHQRASADINDYIARFYNTQRLHSAAGNKPPACPT